MDTASLPCGDSVTAPGVGKSRPAECEPPTIIELREAAGVVALDPFRWPPSSAWRPTMVTDRATKKVTHKRDDKGRYLYEREFRAPHGTVNDVDGARGGCEHCIKPRCCTIASHVFADVDISAYQEPHSGRRAGGSS